MILTAVVPARCDSLFTAIQRSIEKIFDVRIKNNSYSSSQNIQVAKVAGLISLQMACGFV